MAPSSDWSWDQLAAYYANPAHPEQARGEAFRLLRPLIASIHARLMRAWHQPARLKAHFDVDDAISWMADRTLSYQSPGSYPAFCKLVLRNRAIDILRRLARESLSPNDLRFAVADSRSADELDRPRRELAAWVRQRRELLDGIDWRRPAYHAAFLLHQRLRRAAQLAQVVAGGVALRLPSGCRGRSDVLAWLEPWHAGEEEIAFHPAVPPIGPLWTLIVPRLDQPPHWLSGKDLVERLAAQRSSEPRFSHEQWRALTSRANRRARQSVQDDALWSHFFL